MKAKTKTTDGGFFARREREDEAYRTRQREMSAALRRNPYGPLYGADVDRAKELGGAEKLWKLKEISLAHGLRLDVPAQYAEAKAWLDNPDRERSRLFAEVGAEMKLDRKNPQHLGLIAEEILRRYPHQRTIGREREV